MKSSCIIYRDGIFLLNTEHTSYVFRVTPYGHLEHVKYGSKTLPEDVPALLYKRTVPFGNIVTYDPKDPLYSLGYLPMEYGTSGRGDYREISADVSYGNDLCTLDFRYKSHKIYEGNYIPDKKLPKAYGASETLEVLLEDEVTGLEYTLVYSVYPEEDVITRRAVLSNRGKDPVHIRKLMSFSFDMIEDHLVWMTFNGAWTKEFQKTERKIEGGHYANMSRTSSSSYANPGSILRKEDTTEDSGRAWGFNLIYSGNFYASVEKSPYGTVRIMEGLSPEQLDIPLSFGESFETPEAVLTYTGQGLNTLSDQFHRFIRNHILRGNYQHELRPVLVNSWESFNTNVTESRIVSLAQSAKELGIETVVMDDGWFKGRINDQAGLGDYTPDYEKLPEGIAGLAEKIHAMGMKFGIWIEPESVSPDSDLYRAHPEYALTETGRIPVYGRNQLLLDLTNPEVREYIVREVENVISSSKADYIKWDMNRHLAGLSGKRAYDNLTGLYEILGKIAVSFPDVLIETCASGGNRFDLGMMCYSSQIWLSDDTDPVERQRIQRSASYLYPLCVMGAHVAAETSQQTLRYTPLHTRFHTAAFGSLGYEFDIRKLTEAEKEEIRNEVAFYKEYRKVFQFGRFYRLPDGQFCVSDGDVTVVGTYRQLVGAVPVQDTVYAANLQKDVQYSVKSRKIIISIEQFGNLAESIRKDMKLGPDADRIIPVQEEYACSGSALTEGFRPVSLFAGAGYSASMRLPNDFGSELYVIQKQ